MTNPYLPGSDYDAMAGLPVNPSKYRAALRGQFGKLALAGAAAVGMAPRPIARPILGPQGQAEHAEAFEAARGDESMFGMDSVVAVVAGTTGTVFTGPQKPVIPTKMVVSDATANAFVMSNLSVGVEPVFLTNGVNISLAAFTAQSTAPSFRAVLCHVGNTISAVITNISGADTRFVATIYGVTWLYGGPYG